MFETGKDFKWKWNEILKKRYKPTLEPKDLRLGKTNAMGGKA
jgi:hypothetical protein